MPTGYTAQIADGITFNEFIMSCARAFGALVTMRDSPSDAPIPECFKPSNYHKNNIRKTEEGIAELKAMTIPAAMRKAKKAYQDEIKNIEKEIQEKTELRAKYEEMLGKVKAWIPPTSDHIELKKFMVDQITSSIKFDCNTDYYTRQKPKELTGKEWKEQEFQKRLRDLDYHKKGHIEEVQRVEGRNIWVKQLRESLK